jgi:predicted Zn-dependent protease
VASSRLEALKALLVDNPNDSFIRYGLANEYYKAGQFEECIEQIKEYLKLADDEGAVYRILGQALLRLNKREDARQAYEQGIQAAERHSHPGMAEEYRETIEEEFA